MDFVVCTHSYLLLVTVNPKTLSVDGIRTLDRGYFDGADVTSDGELIAAIFKTRPWYGDSPGRIRWYNRYGPDPRLPDIEADDVVDPHQMTLTDDNRALFCTSTADNTIVLKNIADLNDCNKIEMLMGRTSGDWAHVNSFCIEEREIDDKTATFAYICFHHLGSQPSQILLFEWNNLAGLNMIDLHDCGFYGVHNCEVADGMIHYNASDDGRVIRTKWQDESDREEAIIADDLHPKGMALTDRYCVVGYSEHAVSTPRRYISRSGLAFIDRESWEVVGLAPIILEDGTFAGNINEVRYYGR